MNRDEEGRPGRPEDGQEQPGSEQWARAQQILDSAARRWDVVVLRCLATGKTRPADLLAAAAPLSRGVMFSVLRRLHEEGLVQRTEVAGWPKETHYQPTPAGLTILNEVSMLGSRRRGLAISAEVPGEPVPDIDVTRAQPARMWNYWLGGKDNYAADREAADRASAAMPSLPTVARAVRRFQADAVTRLIGAGVRQFLDIGTGLPAAGSVHEAAQVLAAESRVVYVDNDPLVLAHARALLTSTPEGACAYLRADLREPGKILARAGETLDLSRPVAILLLAVLHFVPDEDDPWAITSRLVAGITGDAYLVISHGASDLAAAEAGNMAREYNVGSAVPITMRTREQVHRFFAGMEMLPPGLVPLGQWPATQARQDDKDQDAGIASHRHGHVGMGWRPARARPGGSRRRTGS